MPVATAALATGLRKKKAGEDDEDTPRASSAKAKPTKYQYIADAMKQAEVKAMYQNSTVQWSIAGLIVRICAPTHGSTQAIPLLRLNACCVHACSP